MRYRTFATIYLPPIYWSLSAVLALHAFVEFLIERDAMAWVLSAWLVGGFWILYRHATPSWRSVLLVSVGAIVPLVGFYAWLQQLIAPNWLAFVLAPIAVAAFWLLNLLAVELAVELDMRGDRRRQALSNGNSPPWIRR